MFMGQFTGKNILVVGASSGIGFETAKALLAEGATVYSASRRPPAGLDTIHVPLDVREFPVDFSAHLPGTLHGLVYCPGSITLKPFGRLTEQDFLNDFTLNVLGAVKSVQAALGGLKAAQGAGVVMFSTVAAQVGMGFHASIAASKGAVEGLAKSLAAELAPVQVRVNVIAPSLTDTPLANMLLSNDEKRAASGKRHPLGRVGTPVELAKAAVFLLSDGAAWITGQTLAVDGGMSGVRML